MTYRMEASSASHCTKGERVSKAGAPHYMNKIEGQALISMKACCSPASMVSSKAATLVDAEMQRGCGNLLGTLRWGGLGHACMCGQKLAGMAAKCGQVGGNDPRA